MSFIKFENKEQLFMGIINLHFFVDEKVVSRCIQNFEDTLPGKNKYIVIIPHKDYLLSHVKTKCDYLYAVPFKSKEFYEAIGDLRQYKNVIIHLMTWNMFCFVSEHPEGNFTWVTWGSDLYSDLLEARGYRLYYDKIAFYKALGRYSLLMRIVRSTIGRFVKQRRLKVRVAALKNLSRISTTSGDYNLLMKYFPEAHHLQLVHMGGYYPIDVMISKEMMSCRVVGKNIIVGNSAYGHGNHVEVFLKLKDLDLTGRKVIVPLSYGDVPNYIIQEGKALLGDRFEPIVDFMPLKEYNNILLSSSIFIYGNYRQAAVGNIIVALYVGGKVFLNKNNPLLEVYRKVGCVLFSIDDLDDKMDYELTEKEVEQNRRAILSISSYEYIQDCIRNNFSF